MNDLLWKLFIGAFFGMGLWILLNSAVSADYRDHPEQYPPIKYERKNWTHWIDEDKDCLNTRHEVLHRDSVIPARVEDCKVVEGSWQDVYSGETITDPTKLDVDHVVPLGNASSSAGWRMSRMDKRKYANDMDNPTHLLAVGASLNRQKGKKGPEDWMPPDESYHCEYIRIWLDIKERWSLTLTVAEARKVAEVLGGCNMPGVLDQTSLDEDFQFWQGHNIADCYNRDATPCTTMTELR